MKAQIDKTREQQRTTKLQKEPNTGGIATITDNRPSTIYQRRLQEMMKNSPRVQSHAPLRAAIKAQVVDKVMPIQRKPDKTEQVNILQHEDWINTRINNPEKSTWTEMKVEEEKEGEPKKINPTVLHNGVKETGRKNKRKVWQGATYYKKTPARSFASPFPSSYLHTVVSYNEPELMEYEVEEENTHFYTAVKQASVGNILEKGLDPNYGNNPYPVGNTTYNTRGFNYFGLNKKVPEMYGDKFMNGEYEILTFTMPKDTTFEVDPEIPDGCRTQTHIRAEWIVNPEVKK